MRVIVMFDLPVGCKREIREYSMFRKYLIKNGFLMVQYSIYSRICINNISADKYIGKIKRNLPQNGHVRVLVITEKQYAGMSILLGEKSKNEDLLQDKRFISL